MANELFDSSNPRRSVTFDRNKIRENIHKFQYNEARRVQGPIYEALINELYESGCTTGARQLQILAEKERNLINDEIIRDEVQNEPHLLRAVFENAKMAEIIFRKKYCRDGYVTFLKLYECIQLVEAYGTKFDWLLKDLYVVISKICTNVEPRVPGPKGSQIIARIFFKHGQYLSEKNRDLPKSLMYLEKAIAVARPNNWKVDENDSESQTMHEAIAQQLSRALMKNALTIAELDIMEAIKLSEKAIVVIAEVHSNDSKIIYSESHVVRAELLFKLGEYEKALQLLEEIQSEIISRLSWDYGKLTCKLLLLKGMCLQSLGVMDRARLILRQANTLSERLGLKYKQAEICLQFGKLCSQIRGEHTEARQLFGTAKSIYAELRKVQNEQCAAYLLAKLQADQIFPDILNLLKGRKDQQFCRLYSLMQWKNRCEPFIDAIRDDVSKDSLHCLLRPYPQNLLAIRMK